MKKNAAREISADKKRARTVSDAAKMLLAQTLLFAVLLCLYFFSMPPDITFEDTPIFAAACYTRGIVHPPGYPLAILFCWPFAQLADLLPLSPAKASALASAVAAAAACALLARVLWRETGDAAAAVTAAGLLGLAPSVWSQAIIPEAYALNLLLAVASFAIAAAYARDGGRGWLAALALVAGLGLANHWPLFMLAFPAAALLLLRNGEQLLADLEKPKYTEAYVALFALGLTPYLQLLWPAEGSFQFIGGEERELLSYISRSAYGLGSLTAGPVETLVAAGLASLRFVTEFPLVFSLLGIGGMILLAVQGKRLQLSAVLWAMLSSTLLLALLRPYASDSELSSHIFSVYPLVGYAWFALPLAAALARLFSAAKIPDIGRWGAAAAALTVCATLQFDRSDRSEDDIAARYGELLARELPRGSLLIGALKDYQFVWDYRQSVVNDRPDVEVVRETDYFPQLPDNYVLGESEEQLLAAEKRPVAFMHDYKMSSLARTFRGPFLLLGGDSGPGGTAFALSDDVRAFYRRTHNLLDSGLSNAFSRDFAKILISALAYSATRAKISGAELAEHDEMLYTMLAATPVGKFSKLRARIDAGVIGPVEIIGQARALLPLLSEIRSQSRAVVLHILATELLLGGNMKGAEGLYHSALRIDPENSRVLIDLLQLLASSGQYRNYRDIRMRFPYLKARKALARYDSDCRRRLRESCRP